MNLKMTEILMLSGAGNRRVNCSVFTHRMEIQYYGQTRIISFSSNKYYILEIENIVYY